MTILMTALLALAALCFMHARVCVGNPTLITSPGVSVQTAGEEAVRSVALPAPAAVGAAWHATTGHDSLKAQLPVVVEDAVVTGPATAAEARAFAATMARAWHQSRVAANAFQGGLAAGEAWGARSLLHGKRRPSAYSKCNRCTIVECNFDQRRRYPCSGHCKKRGRLFLCQTNMMVAGVCVRGKNPPNPATLPADRLKPLASVVVTATAPFIGCANITGVPNGCPTPGTTGRIQDFSTSTTYKVSSSSCVQHLYDPPCLRAEAFFPFGYCQCSFTRTSVVSGARGSSSSIATETGPCSLKLLDWRGPAGDAEDVPVRVAAGAGETRTEIAEREGRDTRLYGFEHEFQTAVGEIAVSLELYSAFPVDAQTLLDVGPV